MKSPCFDRIGCLAGDEAGFEVTSGFEVSPKSILDLASDRMFNELNVEPSLVEPSFIESSLLESSTDSNVSIRRKNRKFLGEQF